MSPQLHDSHPPVCWYLGVVLFLLLMILPESHASSAMNADQQATLLKGRITDESNTPLPGVNIFVRGTSLGTSSDSDGNYSIQVTDVNSVLVFSFIGYATQEHTVSGKTELNITMAEDLQSLGEVVVVGYGAQEKQTVTSAISTTKGEELVRSPVSNLTNSLAGRVAGVIAVQRNAEPGDDAAELLIRGRASLNDNNPLVMVDGIQREFSQIDPNEIETVSILKDASATAIYGVRGANGVILVTTKRGTSGKPSFSYTGYVGFQNPTKTPDYLNSYDYARLFNEATLNDNPGLSSDELPFSADDIEKYRTNSDPFTHPNVNWYNEIQNKNAVQQRHSLSVSGGTDKLKYFFLVGYFDQDGMFGSVNYQKINLRSNIDAQLTNTTKLSVGIAGDLGERTYPGIPGSTVDGGLFSLINYLPPNAFPVRNANGSWASLWGANPVADITESGSRVNNTNNLQTSFVIDQKLDVITKGLSAKIVFAYDFGYNSSKDWYTPYKTYQSTGTDYEEIAAGQRPALYQGAGDYRNTTFETHINYDRTFGKHKVGALVLYTQSAFYESEFSAFRREFPSAALPQLFAGPLINYGNNGSASESGREGLVGRLIYQFDNRYLFEADFAYNGSENFPEGSRYGFFPGGSVGWNISNERFFENMSNTISNLKLRASYGEVGNDRVGYRRFLYKQPMYFGDNYVFGGQSGQPVQTLYPGELANANVTWERAKKTNFGLDADYKGALLGFSANVFFETRDNILAQRARSVPGTFGASLPVENIARVDNAGFELELRHNNSIGDFTYYVSANFTKARNKVAFIDEPSNVPAWRRQTGRPIGQFFGYQVEGLYRTQEELDSHPKLEGVDPQLGEFKYKDINGDGIISADDRTAIGRSATPENIFGLTVGGRYKGFDFNMLWQGASGYDMSFAEYGGIETFIGFIYGSSALTTTLDRWSPETPNGTFPRLSLSKFEYRQERSTYWLNDASYVRLRTIELGYTFPSKIFGGHVSKLRLYVAASNPLTFSKMKVLDPEAPSGFPNFYPVQKLTSVGLNLNF